MFNVALGEAAGQGVGDLTARDTAPRTRRCILASPAPQKAQGDVIQLDHIAPTTPTWLGMRTDASPRSTGLQ